MFGYVCDDGMFEFIFNFSLQTLNCQLVECSMYICVLDMCATMACVNLFLISFIFCICLVYRHTAMSTVISLLETNKDVLYCIVPFL